MISQNLHHFKKSIYILEKSKPIKKNTDLYNNIISNGIYLILLEVIENRFIIPNKSILKKKISYQS